VRSLEDRTTDLYPCEVDLLDRWCKLGGDAAVILEAVRLFNAKIVRIETFMLTNLAASTRVSCKTAC
jgi:hypothetical protein